MLIRTIEEKNNGGRSIAVATASMASLVHAFLIHSEFSSISDFVIGIICYLLLIVIVAMLVSILCKQRINIYTDRIDVRFGIFRKRIRLCDIEKCYLRNLSVLNIRLKNGKSKEIILSHFIEPFGLVDFLKNNNICIEVLSY